MSDKSEALSQPVAYTDREELESMHGPNADTYANLWTIPHGCGQDLALYSQEYVTALLAELEETRSTLKNVTECWNDEYQRNKELGQLVETAAQTLKVEQEQSAYYEKLMWQFHGLAETETERAEAAKRREENLKSMIDVVSAKNAELEQRLQQPIAIPAGFRIVPIKATREQLAAVQVAGKSVVYTDMVLAAPEHPGFKVEGE